MAEMKKTWQAINQTSRNVLDRFDGEKSDEDANHLLQEGGGGLSEQENEEALSE